MKTTIFKDVDIWLASAPVKKNIEFLEEGLDPAKRTIGLSLVFCSPASASVSPVNGKRYLKYKYVH